MQQVGHGELGDDVVADAKEIGVPQKGAPLRPRSRRATPADLAGKTQ